MSFGCRIPALSTRAHAALLRAQSSTKARNKAASARAAQKNAVVNPRYELMKQILYQQPPRELPVASDEDVERHMAILRAEKIHKMTASAQRRAERERKFAAMVDAYDALAKADPRLYEAACKQETTVVFPRQMRVPTETPPVKLWDYSSPS
ncbi:hypothetical protein LPJ63_004939 [Coemansia sp. RSA 2711]|nr:hypothetical protein LPJ63_004939 [Coemansia sp. RSA 2711]KAJ1848544.1 hypothetical protein LPJ70_000977 [Coemansia sp. RSA 2708]KAJ2311561.1 hypothetical protein IWW54_002569 [Coemansia sp. RSA 2705]KAJ2365202.1 hypothetical protein H4S01_003378 [Coemansia sp. RSA 2610]KAJ2387037.1 hypothetical protein H4S02_003562 [Coemansia sp. RSA 2611]